MSAIEILDIRSSKDSTSSTPYLRTEVIKGLSNDPGKRTLPSELLYDEVGLKIYNESMKDWSKWYYLIVAETEIVTTYGRDIAAHLGRSKTEQAVIVELGAGSLEKTAHILTSLASLMIENESNPPVTYYALDLERSELNRTLSALKNNFGNSLEGKISVKGMWGTYEDGIRTVKQNELCFPENAPVHFLFLGGTIGNFQKCEADIAFLKMLPLDSKRGDTLIVGVDKAKSAEALEYAYGFDSSNSWIMNGLRSAGVSLCGKPDLFGLDDWERYGKYNEDLGRYEAGYKARKDVTIRTSDPGLEIDIKKGEVIRVMFSNKYTDIEINQLLGGAGLERCDVWTDSKQQYYLLAARRVLSG